MILPGETEAGSAGTQPCRGLAWWAYRNDEWQRRNLFLALLPNPHRIGRHNALKIPARKAEFSITENALSPFQAEPAHEGVAKSASSARAGSWVPAQRKENIKPALFTCILRTEMAQFLRSLRLERCNFSIT
jgi:hypothetical protein